MSRICDVCGQAAREYMKAAAWWGKYLEREDSGDEKRDRWSVAPRHDLSGLTADVCRQCVDEKLSKLISFNHEFSERLLQERAIEERQKRYPNESVLKSLRMTIPGGIDNIFCDLCQTSCFEKHLKLESRWQYPDYSTLAAYACEQCVSERLIELIGFQPCSTI